MRLYSKFFLCATLVISIALLLSGYLLIVFSHESAVNREVERALNQFQYDKFTVQAKLILYADNLTEGRLQNILHGLSSDLSGLTVFFNEDKQLIYSDLPSQSNFSFLNDISGNTHAMQFQTTDEVTYIMVCGKITQGDVTLYLLIATDISAIIVQKEQMIVFVNKNSHEPPLATVNETVGRWQYFE